MRSSLRTWTSRTSEQRMNISLPNFFVFIRWFAAFGRRKVGGNGRKNNRYEQLANLFLRNTRRHLASSLANLYVRKSRLASPNYFMPHLAKFPHLFHFFFDFKRRWGFSYFEFVSLLAIHFWKINLPFSGFSVIPTNLVKLLATNNRFQR